MDANKAHSATRQGKLNSIDQIRFSGICADILLGGNTSPMTVMRITVTPGMGAPVHISQGEDKVFHVMKGSVAFLVGAHRTELHAGDCIFAPKGVAHGFTALGGDSATILLIATPSRHDQFFRAMAALPDPHTSDQVNAVCQRFEQIIVGPIID